MATFTLTPSDRIRRQADFDAVYNSNRHAADDCLVVVAARNGLVGTRVGLSVSRRVGNAVVRNRWKRRIREAFRLQRRDLPPGLDLVYRPRRGASPSFHQIYESVRRLAIRVERKLPT